MKIALISPYYAPATRGNAVTVRRIEKELRRAGCTVAVFPVADAGADPALPGIEAFAPDLIHAFHGYLGGRAARRIAARLAVPYIITLTGTDVYEALTDARRDETGAALAGAARLIVFHQSVRTRLAAHFPGLAARTAVIPQGVEMPGEAGCDSPDFALPARDTFTFFLPAGLRPVKNVLFPLRPLARLHREHPRLHLLLAGPVLDAGYAATVLEHLQEYRFARYAGEIDHDVIGCLYRSCDVVLNTSVFEGGMANTVLEAMASGTAILASDIEGNRSVIRNGDTGLLYRDEEEFFHQAGRLLADAELRKSLGDNGRRLAGENFTTGEEETAYLTLYRAVRASSKETAAGQSTA